MSIVKTSFNKKININKEKIKFFMKMVFIDIAISKEPRYY